jgi:transcriptional regulator with XRE-family HTH domain
MSKEKTGGREYYRRIKRAFGDASDGKIAERLNVTRQAVSLWKTDKSEPDGMKLIRAAELTGVRLEWFISGDERYFTHDASMRPYSGPEHDRIAAAIDAEFNRVAKEEGVEIADLVAEVAALLGIPERNIYNYRAGKWSVPASIIPEMSMRFKSTAILKEILGEHVARAIKPLVDGLEKQIARG